jgi:hypothetical protein
MVHSEFLSTHGIRDFRIYLSDDNAKLPVLVRFKSQKAEFQATLAAVAVDQPDPGPDPTLSPTPVPTPTTAPSPRATPSPRPYVENEPLLAELGFDLGEKLTYRVSVANQPLATVAFEAVERKLFQQRDSLLLTATVTGVDRQNPMFRPGDTLRAQIDPVTLAPRWVEGKFGPGLAGLNQTVTFDTKTGAIAFGGPKGVDAPIGTHSLLTLMYAMRSFNLSASKNPGNPVNDTRVAVFWESKPYVFTLRPSEPADLNFDGEKISAQLITINTGNPQLDALGIKVWLSASTRVPLRFAVGQYQADLISIPKAAF